MTKRKTNLSTKVTVTSFISLSAVTLKAYYKTLINILEAVCEAELSIRDQQVNKLFMLVQMRIGDLLQIPLIATIEAAYPKVITHLIGNQVRLEEDWMQYKDRYYTFLAVIDAFLIKHNFSEKQELEKEDVAILKTTNDVVSKYQKHITDIFNQYAAQIPAINTLTCGKLSLNSQTGLLIYEKKQITVDTGTTLVKLLLVLLRNKNTVVPYPVIWPSIKDGALPDKNNKLIAREIGYVRRDLLSYLGNHGLKESQVEQIGNMITTHKATGLSMDEP